MRTSLPILPKRSLGQNFLIDPNYQRKIISTVCAFSPTHVIEVGPGRGALTHHLAKLSIPLTLIEKDGVLAKELAQHYQLRSDIHVVHQDFLKTDLSQLMASGSPLIVGNLPYNISSQILIHALKGPIRFQALLFMFQKELAQRILAGPGTKAYSLISLWAQAYAKPRKLFDLPATAFRPRPRVESTLLCFKPRTPSTIPEELTDVFWHLIPQLFRTRRKQIGTSLASVFKNKRTKSDLAQLFPNGLLQRRIGELGPDEMVELVKVTLIV